jgi:hypothetical protein
LATLFWKYYRGAPISEVCTSGGVCYRWNEIHNSGRLKAVGDAVVFIHSSIKYVNWSKFYCGGGRVCDEAKPILFCNESRLTLQIIGSVSVLTCVGRPTDFRRGELLLHMIRLCNTRTHSVGLLWTRDRPVVEMCTWQHILFTADRHPCPQRNWNTQSQLQAHTRQTARPLGLACGVSEVEKYDGC